jgi:hypothetical protein
MFGRSQWPRPDRFQVLLQRQTRSLFCLQVAGQDKKVGDGAHDEMMVKASPGAALVMI